jgi:hypothetical protein
MSAALWLGKGYDYQRERLTPDGGLTNQSEIDNFADRDVYMRMYSFRHITAA